MADEPERDAHEIDDAEYRRTLEAALDRFGMGVVIARDSQVVFASATQQRLIGYTLDELLQIETTSLIAEGQRAEIEERRVRMVSGDGEAQSFDVRARHASGRMIDLHVVSAPLPGPHQEVLSLVRDVTTERDLQRQSERAHRMQAIGQLCSGIAHDFNNYLTAVRLITESLATADEVERETLLAELETVTTNTTRLTRQLQTFAGADVQRSAVLDVNIVVFEMAAMLRRVTGRHIELALNLEPGLPLTQINAAQLQQIIVNLVVNAGHAIGRGGGRVTVQTQTERREVILTVTDDGSGMDDETLSRAFEPLFSTHPETGAGMGLAIVYGIARQCGGQVEIESEVGRGTSVEVRLPVTDRGTKAPSGRAVAVPEPARALQVLIVEGEEQIGGLIESGLRRDGFDVQRVAVKAAADALQRRAFDAVVIDVEPPGDPSRALRIFRAQNPTGRIVFVSQPPTLDDSDWDSVTHAVVPKPFTVAELITVLRSRASD